MALSPADFYAYSRATGAPIPEDPQERADMAPEVLEFRRNQLKAPQQESNPLNALGAAALGLGALAGLGFGARRLMRREPTIPQGPRKSATAGVRQVDLADMEQAVRRAATESSVPVSKVPPSTERQRVYEAVAAKSEADLPRVYRPKGGLEDVIPQERANELDVLIANPRTGEMFMRGRSPQGFAENYISLRPELTGQRTDLPVGRTPGTFKEFSEDISLTDLQQAQRLANTDQFINAVESGEDQMTGRRNDALQRDIRPDAETNLVPQEENTRALSSEELKDLALSEMIQLRQTLTERGLRPGTTRFDRALAASWTSKAGLTPGSQAFRESISLPSVVRNAVEAVTPDLETMGGIPIPERTVLNIGPDAVITQTAAGTAIRGASPSYHEALPRVATRQLFGTPDVLVRGAPDELGLDLPGGMRITGGLVPDAPPEQLSKQEIVYSILDRPSTEGPAGGSAGIGLYDVERGYVPGAVSKVTGQYSAAASRKPTDVPSFILKQERTPFTGVSNEGLRLAQERSTKSGANAIEQELQRRQRNTESVVGSEILRRARIEGRDSQMILKQMGIGI